MLVNGPPRGDVRVVSGERVLRIPRDSKTEQRAAQRLAQTGLERRHTQRPEYSFFHDDTEWLRFVAEEVPNAIERLVDTYLVRRSGPDERFIDLFRRLGKDPFKEALYGNA